MGNDFIYITPEKPEKIISLGKPKILNFFNMNSVFWFFRNEKYRKIISNSDNILFPDGKSLSLKLMIKQQKGPEFTRRFLLSDIAKNKKHFFIGLDEKGNKKIAKITGLPAKKIDFYNPPFIKKIEFPEEEIKNLTKKIKKFKPYFVWVCVGGPKQDILANRLFKKYPCFYFNVGAGIDFFLGKKKEAPRFFTSLGMEWLYRLLTDPKITKKKAWRSFVALRHLGKVQLRN